MIVTTSRLSTYTDTIQTATLGEEVRDAIIEGLKLLDNNWSKTNRNLGNLEILTSDELSEIMKGYDG